jgi:hypothetical protein
VNEGQDPSPHGVTPKLGQEQGARMEAILGHRKERGDAAKRRKKGGGEGIRRIPWRGRSRKRGERQR